MSPARRWYERFLGVMLMFVSAVCLLPLLFVWVWARHEYTVGLSVDLMHALPALMAIIVGLGLIAGLGGFALLRRP